MLEVTKIILCCQTQAVVKLRKTSPLRLLGRQIPARKGGILNVWVYDSAEKKPFPPGLDSGLAALARAISKNSYNSVLGDQSIFNEIDC